LLFHDCELDAAVLGATFARVIRGDRFFLTVTDSFDAAGIDTCF